MAPSKFAKKVERKPRAEVLRLMTLEVGRRGSIRKAAEHVSAMRGVLSSVSGLRQMWTRAQAKNGDVTPYSEVPLMRNHGNQLVH